MIDRIRRTPRPVATDRTRIDPRAAPIPDPAQPSMEAVDPQAAGRRRVNPHDSKAGPTGRAGENAGRKRIQVGTMPAVPPLERPAEKLIRLENPAGYILVASFGDEPWSDAERELLGAARSLADQDQHAVLLVRIDQHSPPCDAAANGVDRVVDLPHTGQPDLAAVALLALIDTYSPRHLIFAEAAIDGDVARRVAAALGERPAVAVARLTREVTTVRCDGGSQEFSRPAPRILLLAPGTGDIPDRPSRREARILPPPPPQFGLPEPGGIVDLGPEPMDAGTVPLDQAGFIVSAGDGVTDWAGFHDVADALSAAVGGSRQVCDAGLLPRSRQVGASGTLVAAKCYVAFGISGAPQHLQGVARCRFIVAVNTDLHAAMVKRADLSIIADAQSVMPALAELARERRHAG